MPVILYMNVLIRFFTYDQPDKADLVENLLKRERNIFLPEAVLPELEYILLKKYRYPRENLIDAYTFLTSQENITMSKQARIAVNLYEHSKLDMADCLIAAYSIKGKLASLTKSFCRFRE